MLANYDVFKALDDPIRGKIVQLLHKKQLNVEQITRRLKKFGYKKAVTTIRHHVEILKDSGLIEIVQNGRSSRCNNKILWLFY